jgi:ABC-type thiamin/hydroxymethylpyrimidine transport system permease subunit
MGKIKMTKNAGMILLGIWLILTGLIPVLKVNFSGFPVIMEVLAIASGVLILLGR